MAVTLSYSNITIRGITYKKGSSFKCYASYSGNGGSEGNASSASALTKGTTYYVHAKASGDNVTYPYAVSTTSGGAVEGWYKENVFPYATYSVKYNANGGSGAPSTQTKTYGTNLTLSSTKPTRTGYTFKGWGTSASDTSVDYAAGATYSKNAAITLYAIWTANTYTISFNANGGSGAPSSVTKTYGVSLTLPTTVPTRANYKFLGWSATKNASTATYSAGGTYTANGTATLYAVWELEYLPPTISSLKAIRCDADGTANDFGTYAKVTFNWECCQLLGANEVSAITVGGTSVSASGTSGSVSTIIGGELSIETAHQIEVVVIDTLKSDGSGTTTKTVSITAAVFAIDFLSGGKGVAFGKPATTENYVDSAWRMNAITNDIAYMHEHSTSGNIVGVGVGSGGTNRGLWSKGAGDSSGHWIVREDGSDVHINSEGDVIFDAAGTVAIGDSGLTFNSASGIIYDSNGVARIKLTADGFHVYDSDGVSALEAPIDGDTYTSLGYSSYKKSKTLKLYGNYIDMFNNSGYISFNSKAGYLCQLGTVSITPSAANTPTSKAVTFPYAFKTGPAVVVSPLSTVPGSTVKGWGQSSVTTTGFTAWVYRSNTTATSLHWIACGKL